MPLHRFLLFLVSFHLFIFNTIAYSINKNNSSITIDFYQCNTNTTNLSTSTITADTLFNNVLNSCNVNCCISNSFNKTIASSICQITVQSFEGICLGRLCYSGKCDNFTSLANITHDYKTKNKTTIFKQILSSVSYIPWSSLVNSTQTKWISFVHKSDITIRDTMLTFLFMLNICLTSMTLIIVIKSLRHANIIANEKSYHYTLL